MKPSFASGAINRLRSLSTATKVVGGVSTGLGIASVYDLMKSRGLGKDVEELQKAIGGGRRVSSKKFVAKIDRRIKVLTNESEIKNSLKSEMGKLRLNMITAMLVESLRMGSNAFAIPGKNGGYIVAPAQTNAEVLAHEVGHIIDFRKKNITSIEDMGPYKPSVLTIFSKSKHESQIMDRENEAWKLAPGRIEPTPLERHALGTYDKGFHRQRGVLAGAASAFVIGQAMMYKMAYGVNSSVGPTGDRDGAQTPGEANSENSATGIGESSHTRARSQKTRGPGNQGGRGVPEWLRMQKYMRSPNAK